jgi:threonine/homoserine efflux transporter RhtA
MVMTRDGLGIRLGGIIGALALGVWGIVILVQVANDETSNDLLGWVAVIAGALYLAVAWLRWRREAAPASTTA